MIFWEKVFSKYCTLALVFFTMLVDSSYSQEKSSWTNDIIVAPVAGQFYRNERISTGFNGTIYVARVIANSATGATTKWEVLKSNDNGLTFDTFVHSDPVPPANSHLTALDIVAAGNDSADFKLFIVRCYIQLGTTDTVSIDIDTVNLYNIAAAPLYTEKWSAPDASHRGITSVSIATDARDKNSAAAPYSISVAMAKTGPVDSVIVFTDNNGGTVLHRVSLYGVAGYIHNVSTSIGSASSASSPYGRLGIAWDEFPNPADTSGTIKAAFINPNDGSLPAQWGPFDITLNNGKYRRPSIALSQNGGNIGPASGDIRAMLAYEFVYPGPSGQISVFARLVDSVIYKTPSLTNATVNIDNSGVKLYPNSVYDPINDNFLFTYYDATANALPYKRLSVTATPATVITTMIANYRNAATPITTSVAPRVDIAIPQGSPAFVWNDNSLSMFDAQFAMQVASFTNISDFTIYPNPSEGNIALRFSATSGGDANISVTDMLGRRLLSMKVKVNDGLNMASLNTSGLVNGSYLLQLKGENMEFTSRIVVRK
jgi:hypothetical protein